MAGVRRRVPVSRTTLGALLKSDPNCSLCLSPLDPRRCVAVTSSSSGSMPGLDKALRDFRTEAARGAPAYHVMTNRSIEEIIVNLPKDIEELLGIHGIGATKAERYGAQILDIVSNHLDPEGSPADLNDITLVCVDCKQEQSRQVAVPEGILKVLSESEMSFKEAVLTGLSSVISDLEGQGSSQQTDDGGRGPRKPQRAVASVGPGAIRYCVIRGDTGERVSPWFTLEAIRRRGFPSFLLRSED